MVASPSRIEALAAVQRDAPDVLISQDMDLVRRRSTDRSALLGPLMAVETSGAVADAVAAPVDEEQVIALLAACARHGVPVVPRGAGTSNFGQTIPLDGGIVVDLSALTGVLAVTPGSVRCRAGTMLPDIDEALAPHGTELRIHPSSKRMSTAAGFVIGGHGGIGSIRYGGLADLGNVMGLRVITAETTPRVIELRGEDTSLVQFSFGMSGVVTEVEFATTTAWEWRDVMIVFDSLGDAMRFGVELTVNDGLDVKNCMMMNPSMAAHLTPLSEFLPDGHAAALCMVAPHALEGVADMAAHHGGRVTMDMRTGDGPRGFPGYEYTWGHAMWWLRKQQSTLAEVLFLLPEHDPVGALDTLVAGVEGDAWVSSTCQRIGGHAAPQVAFGIDGSVPGQLAKVSAAAEALGCLVVNIHRPKLTSASIRGFGPRQRAFKADVDPHGIMNPGHLEDEIPSEPSPGDGSASGADALEASGWATRFQRDATHR
ncbi:FAD-binding oxidoreductase [soil metagenome]